MVFLGCIFKRGIFGAMPLNVISLVRRSINAHSVKFPLDSFVQTDTIFRRAARRRHTGSVPEKCFTFVWFTDWDARSGRRLRLPLCAFKLACCICPDCLPGLDIRAAIDLHECRCLLKKPVTFDQMLEREMHAHLSCVRASRIFPKRGGI